MQWALRSFSLPAASSELFAKLMRWCCEVLFGIGIAFTDVGPRNCSTAPGSQEDVPRHQCPALLGHLRLQSSSVCTAKPRHFSRPPAPSLLCFWEMRCFFITEKGIKVDAAYELVNTNLTANASIPPGLEMSCWPRFAKCSSCLLPSAVLTVASKHPTTALSQQRKNRKREGEARDKEHPPHPGNPHNHVAMNSFMSQKQASFPLQMSHSDFSGLTMCCSWD